jgi:DNA-binding NarL/FixJ family response regulator
VERVLNTLHASSELDLVIFDYTLYLRWRNSIETPDLTDRQQEVLQHLVGGFTNYEIAKKLYLTEHTVEFHIGNILRKLEARNRTEAAERAHKLGLC